MEISHNFYRQICNIPLNGEIQANQHYAGDKHLRRQRQLYDCGLDTAQLSDCGLDTAQLSDCVLDTTQMTSGDSISGSVLEFNGTSGMCHICDVALTSSIVYEQHVTGKNHTKALKIFETIKSKWKDELTFSEKCYTFNPRARKRLCLACELCFTDFIEFQCHLETKLHKDREKSWSP